MDILEQARAVEQRLCNATGALYEEAANTIAALRAENETLADSCAAKADRIDRLGETVERLTKAGVEIVAWMTHHDDPLIFPDKEEAMLYCNADEEPIALVPASALAALRAENERLKEIDQHCLGVEDELRAQLDQAQADAARLREALGWISRRCPEQFLKQEPHKIHWEAAYDAGAAARAALEGK